MDININKLFLIYLGIMLVFGIIGYALKQDYVGFCIGAFLGFVLSIVLWFTKGRDLASKY